MDLKGPVQLKLSYPDGAALPTGLSFAFEPGQLTVPTGTEIPAQLRLAAETNVKISEYAFVVTASSEGREASIPVLLRIAGIGPQWARQVGTLATDTMVAMATDSQGNLYVAMNSTGSLDGKPNQGDYDGYLLSYTPSGYLRWTAQIASSKTDYLSGIAVDADDTVWVSGYTFGILPGQMPPGRTDGFVGRFAPSGQRLWLKQLGTPEIDKLSGISVSAWAWTLRRFGSTEGSYGSATNAGLSDIWAVRFAGNGQELSSLQIGSDQADYANAVSIDGNQVSYVVGATSGLLPTGSALGLQDAFVLTVQPDGKLGWVRHVGSAGSDGASWPPRSMAAVESGPPVTPKEHSPGQVSMGGQDEYGSALPPMAHVP